MRGLRLLTNTLLASLAALVIVGCGGNAQEGGQPESTNTSSAPAGSEDTSQAEDGGAASTDSVTVGFVPAGIYSYLWHADEAGYFADVGLAVELTPMAGGGEVIPALESGSIQFGVSDALGVINARNGGIQASYVSLNFAQTSESPVHAVMTNDPDVKSPSDLAGKTIATNLSYNTDWTMMRQWLRQHDVDPDTVNFVEVPFPDMLGALRDGTLSAAGVVEPFYQIGLSEGYRVLGHYFTDVRSPNLFTGIVAVEEFIAAEPDLVERFVQAIHRAIEDFNADEQLARSVIANNTSIEPALVDSINLGVWTLDADVSDLEFWVEAARQEGVELSSEIDVDSLLWDPGE